MFMINLKQNRNKLAGGRHVSALKNCLLFAMASSLPGLVPESLGGRRPVPMSVRPQESRADC
jgi:hypothetical protein